MGNVRLGAYRLVDSIILEQPVKNPETNIESLGVHPKLILSSMSVIPPIRKEKPRNEVSQDESLWLLTAFTESLLSKNVRR